MTPAQKQIFLNHNVSNKQSPISKPHNESVSGSDKTVRGKDPEDVDWRDNPELTDFDADDEELSVTPPDVVEALGFDPLDLKDLDDEEEDSKAQVQAAEMKPLVNHAASNKQIPISSLITPVRPEAQFIGNLRNALPRDYYWEIYVGLYAKGYRWNMEGFVKQDLKAVGDAIVCPQTEEEAFEFAGVPFISKEEREKPLPMNHAGFEKFIQDNRWAPSTSAEYKDLPHEYVLRVRAVNQQQFTDAVRFIRRHGAEEPFFKTMVIYYRVGSYKYWTMRDAFATAGIVNRAKE